jgi:hypothetical protein
MNCSNSLQICITFASNMLQYPDPHVECHQEGIESQPESKFILSECQLTRLNHICGIVNITFKHGTG